MKKVIYIVKSELHIYPPCIAQIRMLKKNGVDVEVWYGSCAKQLLAIFDAENIPYVDLHEQRGKLPGKLDRLNNWYQFASAVKKKMKTVKDASQTLFWFGTAETAMPMVGKLKGYNYALTSLELLDDNKTKNRLFSMLTGDAKFIVCCETTRAFIMRNWYGLKKLPYVMPNKPYDFQDARRKTPSIEATKKAIELVQDKKFIIYQGILKSRDYMLEMARAIRDSGTGYYFVLMGLDPENIFADHNATIYRPNCYSCMYAGPNRCGDLTIGDFTGLGRVASVDGNLAEMKYQGISCVLCNSEKGQKFLAQLGNEKYLSIDS